MITLLGKRSLHPSFYTDMAMKWAKVKDVFQDVGLRFAIGAVFIIAAVGKLPMQQEWAETVIAYNMLPISLARLYALALPWVELTIGLCLVLGLFIRPFALLCIPIVGTFIAANIKILATGTKGECNCFGTIARMTYTQALTMDTLLIIAAILIFIQRKRFLVLESRIFPKTSDKI